MKLRFDLGAPWRALQRNFLLKAFSLVFAIGLWAFVNLGARDGERTLAVPIELRNVPAELVLTSQLADTVDVRVRGPQTLLGTIDDRRLKIPFDLRAVRPGTTSFKIDPERLSLPRGVRVTRVSPVEVSLVIERLVERTLPVVLNDGVRIPDGFRLREAQIRPRRVNVIGPASEVQELKQMSTSPFRLDVGASDFEIPVAVEAPSRLVRVDPSRVVVRGQIEEIIVTRDFGKVVIGARNVEGPVEFNPPKIDVRLKGPQRLLEEFQPSAENFYVDLEGLAPGTHPAKIMSSLPDGVEEIRVQPLEVKVKIPAAGARKAG